LPDDVGAATSTPSCELIFSMASRWKSSREKGRVFSKACSRSRAFVVSVIRRPILP
jgi:hypothetical protein